MRAMANKAGLHEKGGLTKHSARKTERHCNVPARHIVQLSGHGKMQRVNKNSSVSKEQQKNMSLIQRAQILQHAKPRATLTWKNASCTTSATAPLTAETEASFIT